MSKITKQEFENWSEKFDQMMRDFIYSASLNGNATEQETKQLLELKALVNVNAKGENPMAVALFLTFLSTFCPDENKVYADTEGLTVAQWIEKYKSRLKEHAEAGGYYQSNQPVDLSSLTERWKKLLDLLENEEQKEQIGSFMSSEDYQIVGKVALFLSSGNEIVGEKKGSHKNKKDIPLVNNYPFLVEDLCGRVEAAQKKLEQAERERETTPVIPAVPLSLILFL